MKFSNIISDPDGAGMQDIYKTLVEELPLPIALYVGREMRVTYVNNSLLKVWGKGDDVIGKTFREALPELEGQPFYDILDNVFVTGIAYQASEDRVDLFIDERMQTFYFNFTYKPLKEADGKVWGVLNTATDVTELVLMRKRLEEAEENSRLALKAVELGTWSMDCKTGLVTLDERAQKLFNYHSSIVSSFEELFSIVHPDDREFIREEVRSVLDPKSTHPYSVKFRTVSSNRLQYLRSSGKVYSDSNGVICRFAGIIQDITEDVLAQKEITKFQALVENSRDLIGITDMDSNVVYLNKAGQNLVGATSIEECKRPSTDFLVEEDLLRMIPDMTEGLLEEGRYSGEIRYKHLKTGEEIPCHLNAFIITDPETHEPLGMASVTRDLREEKARQKEEQKLLILAENSKDLLSILEADGKNSYINKAGKDLLGLESDEQVRTTPIEQLHTPEDMAFVKSEVLPAIMNKGSWAGVMNVRNVKTGEVFPVFNSSIRIDDPTTGELSCVGAIMRDLRPELEAKKVLADREKVFRDITTASPVALWMTDTEMRITYINQIWLNWTGAPLAEQLGFGWYKFIVDEDKERVKEVFRGDFESRSPHECQYRLIDVSGEERWMICSGNPQYKLDGTFTGYIGTCVDITELKQLQQQKDEFLGIASHELKTPVTSIKAYAQVLESIFRDSGDDKKADMVRKMDIQVNRLTNLIGDLLDVTKIQTGKLQFNDAEFQFNDLVKDLVEDLQRTTRKHTIVTEFGEPVLVFSDKERIGQVITNLITNAIKYSPHAEKIIVYTRRENENVRLCVQDFGIGIPNDKKDNVFEQFYRVSGNKQHTFPGLGLGLYISSEIIKREGGTIWVESKEGEGSTFCFLLPLNKTVKSH